MTRIAVMMMMMMVLVMLKAMALPESTAWQWPHCGQKLVVLGFGLGM